MFGNFKLSPLASAYLATITAAQEAERSRPRETPESARRVRQARHAQPLRPCPHAPDYGGDVVAVDCESQEPLDPGPPLTEEEIVTLAIERGLAEIVHLVTMPASRSTKIPLSWDQPAGPGDLEPTTGPANAFRAVRRHVPRMPDDKG